MVEIKGFDKPKLGERIANWIMGSPIGWVIGVLIFILFMWGCFWLAKTGSYVLFYEDMVQETIREMVKKGALIE